MKNERTNNSFFFCFLFHETNKRTYEVLQINSSKQKFNVNENEMLESIAQFSYSSFKRSNLKRKIYYLFLFS